MDTLKTHVTDEEARLSADDVVRRWQQLDGPGREAFLNGVRFTEMRGGALLAYLAESVAFDKDARKNIMRQARDEAKHGYYFSQIIEHLGFEEHPVVDDPLGLGSRNPNELRDVDEETRILFFMLNTEAIELRASVIFDGLNRIFADDPFVGRYLNEIRYDEMFHLGWIGSRLDVLAETRPEVDGWREASRDALAGALAAYEKQVDAAARERASSSSS
ncbi:MAG: hypothetical protein JWO37_3828 [Acidimicrobiales bacterium]|nr:hypothetical protein [Acidimicrobiales bacterium]